MSEHFAGGAGGVLAGLVVGSRVRDYRLEEQVGAGGMAVVFRAVDDRLGGCGVPAAVPAGVTGGGSGR